MDEKTYNSAENKDYIEIKAPYYNAILPTSVCFEQEKIYVTMDSLGHIEFFDESKNSLGFVDSPVDKDPSKYGHTAQYGEIRLSSDGNEITLQLPVYGWDDSYPNCDGESDRWNRYIARWFRILFDCESREIKILDK